MPLKTYALFDVIGVKRAFTTGRAPAILDAFWKASDVWTDLGTHGMVKLASRPHTQQRADPRVRTFSDSALLDHVPEIAIDDFWALTRSLKAAIDRAASSSYVIVCCAHEISHHQLPAAGCSSIDDNLTPKYLNLSGSGPAFMHLFMADEAIRRAGWTSSFEYAVGQTSIPTGASVAHTTTFPTVGGSPVEVFALG